MIKTNIIYKDPGYAPFIYLLIVTSLSIVIIILNELFHLGIPFNVGFLIAYVGALLVFVIWHAVLTKGWKRFALLFIASYGIAFTAEALGVNFGLIFGSYYYTQFLGLGLFGVPFLAAFAWEPIIYASYCICDIIFQNARRKSGFHQSHILILFGFGLTGAFATTAWDLMIDPIAVKNGWWVWINGGVYMPDIMNGVPISNYIGWLSISFIILTLFRWKMDEPIQAYETPMLKYFGPITLYASLFLTSFGVTITILEKPSIALVGFMTMTPFLLIASIFAYTKSQETMNGI